MGVGVNFRRGRIMTIQEAIKIVVVATRDHVVHMEEIGAGQRLKELQACEKLEEIFRLRSRVGLGGAHDKAKED